MLEKLYLLYIYIYHSHLKKEDYPKALKKWFKHCTGKELNLDDPQTFSEKIQWLKLYDSTEQKALLSDKYAVRDWVKEKIGEKYLIPLLGVWEDARDIDFDALPESFVLKTNHSSNWNIIVKDKSKLDVKKAVRKLNRWLSMDYSFVCGMQLHYSLIKRRIIAEKYLENKDGLDDYKILCFDGKPAFIWKETGRFSGTEHKRTIYDTKWNRQDWGLLYPPGEASEPPVCLEEMIEIATVLCKGFCHVRVDLYEVEGRVYFGEMTFTSGSGLSRFYPEEMNKTIGDMIDLEKIHMEK